VELNWSGKALIVTILFRLLFGGYLMGMDQYRFNDVESALTVFLIYVLIGLFATLFLLGKRYSLKGVIGLDVIFITIQSLFIIVTLGQIADAGQHNALDNWWATLLMYMFSILTIIFAVKTYRKPTLSQTYPKHSGD
jgi:hypothetical protein